GDGQTPWGDRGGNDDGADGLPVSQEAVESLLEVLDCGGVHLDQETVFPAYAMALGDLGCLSSQLGNSRGLIGGRAVAGATAVGRMRTKAVTGSPSAAGLMSTR